MTTPASSDITLRIDNDNNEVTVMEELEDGEYNPDFDIDINGFDGTLDDLVSEYYTRLRNDRSESTAQRYTSNVVRWFAWCDVVGIHPLNARPGELKSHLRAMNDQGYAANSMKVRRASVSMLYEQCREMATNRTARVDIDPDVVAENPSEELDLTNWQPMNQGTKKSQAQKNDVTPLDTEEIEQLCDKVPSPELRNELIIRLLYQTGLREGELAQTRIDDINRDERSINVRADKTYLNRTVYYQPSLDFLMDQWLDAGHRDSVPGSDGSPYLFLTRENERMTGHYINRVVIKAARNAGIQEVLYIDSGGRERAKITAHALRHSFAAHSVKNGIDIKNLQELLGHENLETTETYLQFKQDEVRDAARKYGAGVGNNDDWD